MESKVDEVAELKVQNAELELSLRNLMKTLYWHNTTIDQLTFENKRQNLVIENIRNAITGLP